MTPPRHPRASHRRGRAARALVSALTAAFFGVMLTAVPLVTPAAQAAEATVAFPDDTETVSVEEVSYLLVGPRGGRDSYLFTGSLIGPELSDLVAYRVTLTAAPAGDVQAGARELCARTVSRLDSTGELPASWACAVGTQDMFTTAAITLEVTGIYDQAADVMLLRENLPTMRILVPPEFDEPLTADATTVTVSGSKLPEMDVEVYPSWIGSTDEARESQPLCTDDESRGSRRWSCEFELSADENWCPPYDIIDPDADHCVSARQTATETSNYFPLASSFERLIVTVPEPEPEVPPAPEPEPELPPAPEPEPEVPPAPEPEVPLAPESVVPPGSVPASEEPFRTETDDASSHQPESAANLTESTDGSVPAPAPMPAPSTQPTASASAALDDSTQHSGRPGGQAAEPIVYGNSLNTVSEVLRTPAPVVLAAVATGIAFLILVAIPAELLYATIRQNYSRIFVWPAAVRSRWDPLRERLRSTVLGRSAPVLILLTAAAIGSLAEPAPPNLLAALRLYLALLLSLTIMNAVGMLLPRLLGRHFFQLPAKTMMMPAPLLLATASVLVSRLLDMHPGFLFGLLVMVSFGRTLRREQEGVLAATSCASFVALGIAAWLLHSALDASGVSGFWAELVREALTGIAIGGVGSIAVSLLPLTFLEGRKILHWRKRAWAGLYAGTLAAFVLIIVPLPDAWAEADGPMLAWMTVFGTFGIISIGTWAWFRFRPVPDDRDSARTAPTGATSGSRT